MALERGLDRGLDRRALRALVAFLTAVCAGLYLWLEGLLPRGPQELAYLPFLTDPLPFAAMRGFTFEQLARHVLRFALLGPALAGLSWLVASLLPLAPPTRPRWRRWRLLAVGLSVLLSTFVMVRVLGGRAIVDDELTYRYQAELLAEGKLAESSVPYWGHEAFTVWTRLGATGKYLFGEPLVQVVGTLVGLPGLLHLLLAPLGIYAFYRCLEGEVGEEVATWATLLIALSPMLVLTNATGLSHTTTFACFALAGLGWRWAGEGRALAGALLAGTALGFALTVRPQTAASFGLVLGVALLVRLLRRRRWAAAGALVASGSLWLVLIGLYDLALSGSPWRLPWYLYRGAESYGFGAVEGVHFTHTWGTALENLLVTLVRWNGWWLGWPLSFAPLALWLVLGRPWRGAGLWVAAGAALVVFHLPYYSTGVSDTGPVYSFELLLPAAVLGAHGLARAYRRWPRRTLAALGVHLVLGTGSFLAENAARLDRLVTVVHGPVEAALERIEPPALLIHEPSPGEWLRLGWISSFPVRLRGDDEPIVSYPRGRPEHVALLRERYSERACWYYRVDPASYRPELRPCAEAEELLARPEPPPGYLRLPSTAERLGLFDPGETQAARGGLSPRPAAARPAAARQAPAAPPPPAPSPRGTPPRR